MGAGLDFVTVVSGLPRSGTSMAMRMLEAGGMPPLTDRERGADEDNPLGYYEFEPVKTLREDSSWVAGARGRAVKIIYKLVYDLPADVNYRIVFMQRDLMEVLRSQETMLERAGASQGPVGQALMLELFQGEVIEFQRWAKTQRNIEILYLNYSDVVQDPASSARQIAEFLGNGLDAGAMAQAVERRLYRNRA